MMNNKFTGILFSVFLTILLIAGTRTYAQREICVYEPDFNKEYAIHLALYRKLPYWVYPNAYLEFYSDYARKHKIKKSERWFDFNSNRMKLEIYFYNKHGFISKIDRYEKGELVEISVFEYSNHNRTIVRHTENIYENKHAFYSGAYYFNKDHLVDSIYDSYRGMVIFVRGTNKLINEIITSKGKLDLKLIDYPRGFENSGAIFKSMGHYSPQALFFKQLKLDSIAVKRDSIIGMEYYKAPLTDDSYRPKVNKTEIHLGGNYLFVKEEALSGEYPLFAGGNSSRFYQWDAKNILSTFSECYENARKGNLDIEYGNYYSKTNSGWKVRYYNIEGKMTTDSIAIDTKTISWPKGEIKPAGGIEFFSK